MRPGMFGMALAIVLAGSTAAAAQERQIRVSVTVAATPEQVWPLWTTDEGVRSFFAPGSHIELRVDGTSPQLAAIAPASPCATSAGATARSGMRRFGTSSRPGTAS